jgi:hypothetical protein
MTGNSSPPLAMVRYWCREHPGVGDFTSTPCPTSSSSRLVKTFMGSASVSWKAAKRRVALLTCTAAPTYTRPPTQ